MIHLLTLALSCAAFLALALSMKKHQRDLAGRHLPQARARAARIAGWLLIALAWALEVVTAGAAEGTIVWVGLTSMGAWAAIAVLQWRGRQRAG